MGGGGTCALKDVLQPFSYKNNPILRMGEKRWGGGGGAEAARPLSPIYQWRYAKLQLFQVLKLTFLFFLMS